VVETGQKGGETRKLLVADVLVLVGATVPCALAEIDESGATAHAREIVRHDAGVVPARSERGIGNKIKLPTPRRSPG